MLAAPRPLAWRRCLSVSRLGSTAVIGVPGSGTLGAPRRLRVCEISHSTPESPCRPQQTERLVWLPVQLTQSADVFFTVPATSPSRRDDLSALALPPTHPHPPAIHRPQPTGDRPRNCDLLWWDRPAVIGTGACPVVLSP